jgi:hypothetical protein
VGAGEDRGGIVRSPSRLTLLRNHDTHAAFIPPTAVHVLLAGLDGKTWPLKSFGDIPSNGFGVSRPVTQDRCRF